MESANAIGQQWNLDSDLRAAELALCSGERGAVERSLLCNEQAMMSCRHKVPDLRCWDFQCSRLLLKSEKMVNLLPGVYK